MASDRNPPRYLFEAVNGEPSVSFTSVGAEMTSGLSDTIGQWLNKPVTILCVAKIDSLRPGHHNTLISPTTSIFFGFGVTDIGEIGVFAGDGMQMSQIAGSELMVRPNEWNVITYRANHGLAGALNMGNLSLEMWQNGMPSEPIDSLPGYINNTGFITVGSAFQYEGIYTWNGEIAEIVVFESALSNEQRRGVEMYLAEKYGIELKRVEEANLDAPLTGL